MKEIIPALIPKHFEELKDRLGELRGLVPLVQIDLCDGKFVKNITWPFHETDAASLESILNEREGMPYWEEINIELDLMVADGMENFENYIRLGAKRIIFHLEAYPVVKELEEFLEGIDIYVRDAIEIGVAINTTTAVELVFPLIHCIDFVQCMGIKEIGVQGEPFDEEVFTQIEVLQSMFPDLVLQVDGGVNEENARRLFESGVQRLVVGSAIFASEDIVGKIADFKDIARE